MTTKTNEWGKSKYPTWYNQLTKKQQKEINTLLTQKDKETALAVEKERERIEKVFEEEVPPHALSLEDSVWLKRLLNKAFNHNKNI